MNNYLPLLITLISVGAGLATYSYQRLVDRKTSLIEERRSVYRNFLRAFIAMSDSPERVEDIRRSLYQAEFDLILVGSDEVVRNVGALSNFYAETNHDRQNRDVGQTKALFAAVCQSMRKDCFEKSSISNSELAKILPISQDGK